MESAVNLRAYLSVVEVATQLGVNPASVRRWVRDGHLPSVQTGGRGSSIRIPAEALEVWLYSDPGEAA